MFNSQTVYKLSKSGKMSVNLVWIEGAAVYVLKFMPQPSLIVSAWIELF